MEPEGAVPSTANAGDAAPADTFVFAVLLLCCHQQPCAGHCLSQASHTAQS